MISLEDNFQNLDKSSLIFQMESFSLSEINPEGKHEVLFHKGMTIECIQKFIDLYKERIIEKKQGYIKDLIDNFTIYIHFFDKKQGDILVIIYIDNKENRMDYTKLYHFSKSLFQRICSNISSLEIEKICHTIIKIPKVEGMLAMFIVDEAGFLYYSKVSKKENCISQNKVQIAGFISAILCFSQDYIGGKESGFKLEAINVGKANFYMNFKNDVIFAYLVEKKKKTEKMQKYIELISEEFVDKYYEIHVKDFNGDLTPFHEFENIIEQYFII
ncbi:MAG: hypothetical protein ACFFAQ_10290 [Promethearchaeota archaeon]